MSERKIMLKQAGAVTSCPKCGNDRDFTIRSQQAGEDFCDVWGNLHDGLCMESLHLWSDAVAALEDPTP